MSSSLSDICSSGGSRDGVGGSGTGVNSGDWICGDVTCRHSNFARRQQCNKCKRDRSLERSSSVGSGSGSNKKKLGTEIGKAAAEKSRGLFSAEDWQCNKCANVNWARRLTCNMCNAPKFCDVEERTGFGGGYNDRGVVEYKEREESDSEYDEFGRLKKRRKNSHNLEEDQSKITNDKVRINREDDEDEEDEEEEGDDDDLAKYNLFSDDEEVITSAKTANSKATENAKEGATKSDKEILKPSNRRSRSRTRSDIRRRQSYSSSRSSSSSSSTSTSVSSSSSSRSSSSSSSATSSTLLSRSREQSRNKKRSYSRSRSRSRPRSLSKRKRSVSRDSTSKKKRTNDMTKSAESGSRKRYSSKSRSKSRSSHNSSQSPSTKRNRSSNSNSSRKHSKSPHLHRKNATRSRSVTPKRKR